MFLDVTDGQCAFVGEISASAMILAELTFPLVGREQLEQARHPVWKAARGARTWVGVWRARSNHARCAICGLTLCSRHAHSDRAHRMFKHDEPPCIHGVTSAPAPAAPCGDKPRHAPAPQLPGR